MPRKPLPLVAAAAIALVALSVASATEPAPAAPTGTAPKKHAKPIPPPAYGVPTPNSGPAAFDSAKRLAALTEKLNLTPEQQAKMKPVLEDTEAQVKAARHEAPKPAAARDKVKQILEASDIQIQVILDGAQKETWEKMKADVKNANRRIFKTTSLN